MAEETPKTASRAPKRNAAHEAVAASRKKARGAEQSMNLNVLEEIFLNNQCAILFNAFNSLLVLINLVLFVVRSIRCLFVLTSCREPENDAGPTPTSTVEKRSAVDGDQSSGAETRQDEMEPESDSPDRDVNIEKNQPPIVIQPNRSFAVIGQFRIFARSNVINQNSFDVRIVPRLHRGDLFAVRRPRKRHNTVF